MEEPMIPNKLIEAAVIFACMAAASGHLPQLVKAIHVKQYKLLKESRSSNWGKPLLLPVNE